MTTKDSLYLKWAGEFAENLNLEEFEKFDDSVKKEILKAGDYLSDRYSEFLEFWKNDIPERRALFYQRLGKDLSETILNYKQLAYPISIQNLSRLILFIDDMISINQGTPIELATIQANTPLYNDVKRKIQKEIDDIKLDYHKEEEEKNAKSFNEMFNSISQYNYLMNLLISEKLVSNGKYRWIDERNGNLSFLVSIIKTIDSRGYLNQKSKLTTIQIKIIALNHFGTEVSESLISKHKTEQTSDTDLAFIPIASTLEQ